MSSNNYIFNGPTIKLTQEQFERLIKVAIEHGLVGPCYVVIINEKYHTPTVEEAFSFAFKELNKADENLDIYIMNAHGEVRNLCPFWPYLLYQGIINIPYLEEMSMA